MPIVIISIPAGKAVRGLQKNDDRISWSTFNDVGADVFYGFNQNITNSGRKRGRVIELDGGSVNDEKSKGEIWFYCLSAVTLVVQVDVIDPYSGDVV